MIFLNWRQFFGIMILVLSLGSCAINSNMLFKIPKDGSFKYDSIPLRPTENYKISIDDKLTFGLTTNGGKNLIEGITGTSAGGVIGGQSSNIGSGDIQNIYTVKSNGYVEIPIIGDLLVEGLTIQQCEDTLEVLFKDQYQKPFVQLRITNRRCVVFSGNGSSATIVQLENNNTTLLEVLAITGGITPRGKARFVKVMRKVGDKREVYLIDVSTIDGLKYADMIIQGNDYIYVEPRMQLIQGALSEWAPIASLISTILMTYTFYSKFN